MARSLPLAEYFSSLEKAGKAAFMPYITAGYPSPGAMRDIVRMLRECGADCLELGVPFSDPIADGATIQEASQEALKHGSTIEKCLDLAAYAAGLGHRVVLMSYLNPLMQFGAGRLARKLGDCGVQGVIIPDLPLEESDAWRESMAANGVALALFAAPTTPSARLAEIGAKSRAFVYYVSLTGVTGERKALAAGLRRRVKAVSGATKLPVCVGFGVSNAAQARQVAGGASGVIVGSALVRRLGEWHCGAAKRREIARWTREMARAVKSAVKS